VAKIEGRKAIRELKGDDVRDFSDFARPETDKYRAREERIRGRLNLTPLKYQRLDYLVDAIGLPKERVCNYCWDGEEGAQKLIPF
jgi:amidophosphoribosyltransferase